MSIVYELFHDNDKWSYILTVDMPRKLTKEEVGAVSNLTFTIAMTIRILNLKPIVGPWVRCLECNNLLCVNKITVVKDKVLEMSIPYTDRVRYCQLNKNSPLENYGEGRIQCDKWVKKEVK